MMMTTTMLKYDNACDDVNEYDNQKLTNKSSKLDNGGSAP